MKLSHDAMVRCHCGEIAVTNLDGDNLCKTHADEWVRGEGVSAMMQDKENPLTYENYRG